MSFQRHVLHFPGAHVWRDVPQRAGLRSGVRGELLRVRFVRPDVRHFPGADVWWDVPQRAALRSGIGWKLLRVRRVQPGASLPLRHEVG